MGAGGVGELQALLELVDVEAAVARGAAERRDGALAVGVRGPQVGQRARSSASVSGSEQVARWPARELS